MAKPLFDDGEELQHLEQIRVNQDYAKRFEHNKKREELHRLQEKYPEQAAKLNQGDEHAESSSDDDDDAAGLIDAKTQAQIFETILKIRRRDQSIYDAQAKFYSSSSSDEEDEAGAGTSKPAAKKAKKEKPMFLKDVIYKQAMEGGDMSSDEEQAARQQPRTYTQEQQDLKHAFLNAFEENVEVDEKGGDGFGDGVLQLPKGRKQEQAEAASGDSESDNGDEKGDGVEAAAADAGGDEARVQQLLDGYFGRDAEMSAEDKFLKRYILHKGWVEEGDEEYHGGGTFDDAEDEQFVEQAEQFEHAYNFRFEEPGGATVITHPRNVEGTVRKPDDRRKRARAEKAARQAAEEEARQAEVRRLKNLKKGEIEQKLQEIQTVAGRAAPRPEVLDALVAGDFDPEEYDRQMAAAFGDDYYGADGEEVDEDELADEVFERELEAMAGYGSDEENPETFAALHKRLAAQRREEAATGAGQEDEDEDEDEEEEGEEEDREEEGEEGGDPEAVARSRAEVQRLLEEYYRLNYEDVVGGVRTRFRYKEVPADTYGLGVEEILSMDDKELNQVMGLKTLAPYREDHRRFRPNYQKLNQLRKEREEEQGRRHGGGSRQQQQHWGSRQQGQQHKPQWKQRGGGLEREQDGQQQQQQQQQQEGIQQQEARPAKSTAAKRLESFAKPSVKKARQEAVQQRAQDGGAKKRRREQEQHGGGAQKPKQQKQPQQAQQQANSGGEALSKAQKKNLKRAEKRAEKRAKLGGAS